MHPMERMRDRYGVSGLGTRSRPDSATTRSRRRANPAGEGESKPRLVQGKCRVGRDRSRGIVLEVTERSQEQIGLPEHDGVPVRVVAAIEKTMTLTRSYIEFGAGPGAD